MSQSRARTQRKTATPKKPRKPAIEQITPPTSHTKTIEGVANALINLQAEKERLELTRLGNAHKATDPAVDRNGRLLEDDAGEYREDGKRFLSYRQRDAQVEKARVEICKAYDEDTMKDVDALIARNDAQAQAELRSPVVSRS